jgi:hypothetical protein
LNRLVFESRDTEKDHIKLDNMPGGPAAFELAVKFCYGIPIRITRTNVAALRCAAEYLEMTEDLEEGNLVVKTEDFLSSEVLTSWSDSITVLRACEALSPWAEKLQIVKMCSESVAWKACTDPRGIRWSYSSSAGSDSPSLSPRGSAKSSTSSSKGAVIPHDWWFADMAELNLRSFTVVMDAIKAKGMRHDMMGSAVFYYAHRWLPLLSTLDNPESPTIPENSPIPDKKKNKVSSYKRENEDEVASKDLPSQALERAILEGIATLLPPQKDSVPVSGLLRLLRVAITLDCSAACKKELEKRSGMQLDQAALNDLLIPSCPFRTDTVYDVGAIHRCLDHFLVQVGNTSSRNVVTSRHDLGFRRNSDGEFCAGPYPNNLAERSAYKLREGQERRRVRHFPPATARRPADREDESGEAHGQLPRGDCQRPQSHLLQVPSARRGPAGIFQNHRRRLVPRHRHIPQGRVTSPSPFLLSDRTKNAVEAIVSTSQDTRPSITRV